MKRALVFINVLLTGSVAVAVSAIHENAVDAQALRSGLAAKAAAVSGAVIPPPRASLPVVPKTYVAQAVGRFLFSPDRNPSVVEIQAIAPALPPLPAVFGMLLSMKDPTIILGSSATGQRAYQSGEQVGPFKLIRFDTHQVTFEWNGKEIERSIQDLAAHTADAAPSQTSAESKTGLEPKTAAQHAMGPALGPAERACVAGDNLPAGSVSDGYTKVVTRTLFGDICRWSR